MRIIQSYNTFGGQFMNCGFETARMLKKYVSESFKIHSKLCDYTLYTDTYGYEFLKDVIPESNIEIFDFKIEYEDKLRYIGKFQVQEIQTEDYIHVDMDDTMDNLPVKADVYIHRYRKKEENFKYGSLQMDTSRIGKMPCSNMIGFSDMKFQKQYIAEARKWIQKAAKAPKIIYEHAILCEEGVLQNLIVKHNKSVSTICQNY